MRALRFLSFCLPGVLAAQQFAETGRDALPWVEVRSKAVAAGDIDGDGDADVVFGQANGSLLPWRNDGQGRFTPSPHALAGSFSVRALVLADVDGDSDLDLVVGCAGQSRLFRNEGQGRFAADAAALPIASIPTNDVAIGDLDRDGDPDLVFATFGQNLILENDGTGRFTDVTAARAPRQLDPTRAIAVGDVDRDGDLDIVFANTGNEPCTLWLGDGTGGFLDASGTYLPGHRDYTTDVALGDLDGDGDLDLVTATESAIDRVYRNDGSGRFAEVAGGLASGGGRSQTCALADVDGDGDLDVALGSAHDEYYGRRHLLFLNRGNATFSPAPTGATPRDLRYVAALAWVDVDADADPDLLLAAGDQQFGDQPRLYVNDGAGRLRDATERGYPPDAPHVSGLAAGDVDGDGDVDLILANGYSPGYHEMNLVYRNDGLGRLAPIDPFAGQVPAFTNVVQVGDIDGDGDIDVFFGNDPGNDGRDRLFQNDGRGYFVDVSATHLPFDDDFCHAACLGDLDGDGDPDLVVAAATWSQSTLRVFRNDGTGRFRRVLTYPAPAETITAVAIGDIDGDGDGDLLLGRYPTGSRGHLLYRNEGDLRFTDATAGRLPPSAGYVRAAKLGDVDGDGDLDAVLAQYDGAALYRNDGQGVFADATTTHMPRGEGADALAVGDVDGDGDLDLVLSGMGNGFVALPPRLLRNDGSGRFADAPGDVPPGPEATNAVALADLDGDGDLDLALAGRWRSHLTLLRNHMRQIHAPYLATLGRPFRLDLDARGGTLPAERAVPCLAGATANIPLPPFGNLRLDPASLVVLPASAFPTPGARTSLVVPLPRDRALAGRTLAAQALFVDATGGARFSNLLVESIAW